MKITILNSAKQKIRLTAKYIHKEFGASSRETFIAEINKIVGLLRSNPMLGPIESLLEGASVSYRSIVVMRLNKIVYWVNGDIIEIVDFWHCRRNPQAQAGRLMK